MIGCSSGGFQALRTLLGALDPRLPQTIIVCCHTAGSVSTLSQLLGPVCPLPVIEARERMPALAGAVQLAPGGYHLLVDRRRHFALSIDAPVRFSRPSIDVMFETAADVYLERTLGVILTGANGDGALGLQRIRGRRGLAIVQEPATAQSPAMPQAALELAGADHCLALEHIAPLLNRLCLP